MSDKKSIKKIIAGIGIAIAFTAILVCQAVREPESIVMAPGTDISVVEM